MAIGRKANLASPGVAWFSPIVTIFEVAKAHWWPFPVFIVIYLLSYLLVFLSPGLGAILFGASLIFLLVVFHVWHWKTYEAVGRPGWWILVTTILGIIGFVLFFVGTLSIALSIVFVGILFFILTGLSYLILIGIAAWGNSNKQQNI